MTVLSLPPLEPTTPPEGVNPVTVTPATAPAVAATSRPVRAATIVVRTTLIRLVRM